MWTEKISDLLLRLLLLSLKQNRRRLTVKSPGKNLMMFFLNIHYNFRMRLKRPFSFLFCVLCNIIRWIFQMRQDLNMNKLGACKFEIYENFRIFQFFFFFIYHKLFKLILILKWSQHKKNIQQKVIDKWVRMWLTTFLHIF